MDSYLIINNFTAATIILPVVAVFTHFSFNLKKLLPVTLYILFSAIQEAYSMILPFIIMSDTPANITNSIEVLFVGWIVYSFIKDNEVRKIILVLAGIYLLTSIVILCRINSISDNNIIIRGGSTLVSIIFCLVYVFQLSKETNIKIWELFIIGAFLFYYVTTTAMFSFIQLFKEVSDQKYWVYFAVIHLLANIGLNGLLTLGIYKCKVHSL